MTASDVRALHRSHGEKHPVCSHDAQPYPCDTIRALGLDPLDPPLSLPPETMPDGTQVWPGDPRFAVRVRSVYGEAIEQVVEASSLVDALEKAKAIPFEKWMRPEATDPANPSTTPKETR